MKSTNKAKKHKKKRSFIERVKNLKLITVPNFLILGGLLLVGVWMSHWALYYRSLRLDKQLVETYTTETHAEYKPQPVHISIGRMLQTDIEPAVYANNTWTISPDKASHLVQSAVPGQQGNIIIYGHNTEQIMGNIRALTGNEIVTIVTDDGIVHRYQIADMVETDPKNTAYLKPTNIEVLTLYTCSGLFDSKRFIVQAVPLKS